MFTFVEVGVIVVSLSAATFEEARPAIAKRKPKSVIEIIKVLLKFILYSPYYSFSPFIIL
jgi:hypothetical protein